MGTRPNAHRGTSFARKAAASQMLSAGWVGSLGESRMPGTWEPSLSPNHPETRGQREAAGPEKILEGRPPPPSNSDSQPVLLRTILCPTPSSSLQCSIITSWGVGVCKWLLDPSGQGLVPYTPVLPSDRCRPAPQLVTKSACFPLLCQWHLRPAAPEDRAGPPAPPLSSPLPFLLPVAAQVTF